MDTVVLQVRGMSCTGCEQRIDTVLRRIEGVRTVEADHICGRVRVRFAPQRTTREALAARIESLGYQVTDREAMHG